MPVRPRVAEVVLGLGLPAAATVVLDRASDPAQYRPGSVLLLAMVTVAVLAGFRAGLLAALSATVAVWYCFTPPGGSFAVASGDDAVSLLVFVGVAAGVLLLVNRLERSRRAEAEQRLESDALLDGAPMGIALFDPVGRLRRSNGALVRFRQQTGASPEDLLAHPVHRAALERALDEERAVTDVRLSEGLDGAGVERHWRANYYPVRGERGDLLGAGVVVADVTGDVIGRRRSEQLLRLAGELTAVGARPALRSAVRRFLDDAFRGRSDMAFLETAAVDAAIGPDGEPVVELRDDLRVEPRTPWHEAMRSGEIVFVGSAAEHDRRFPDSVADRIAAHGHTCLAVPVRSPGAARPRGVCWVWWPRERPLTDTTRTLAETVASMAALAVTRIELTESVQRDRFRHALDAMLDNVAIGRAVRDEHGVIVDFVLEFLNRASVDGARRTADELLGQRVCELYPSWRETGMFDRFARVVETGEPLVADRMPYRDVLEDGTLIDGYWNLHVVRVDADVYLAASLDVTELVAADEARRRAEAAGERERAAVALLQRAALPTHLPERPNLRFGACYRPALSRQVVGGDWYDAFVVGDSVALVIGDVAGHGPDAAARMVQVRQLVRAMAHEYEQPDRVLRRVNETLMTLDPDGGFVTCCYALVDLAAGTLSLALAGHPPPLLVGRDGGTAFVVAQPGPPLATISAATYPLVRVPLPGAARLVFYTDGLVELRGELIDIGLERLRGAVLASCDTPADRVARQLADSVDDPDDDVAVLVVDTGPPRPKR